MSKSFLLSAHLLISACFLLSASFLVIYRYKCIRLTTSIYGNSLNKITGSNDRVYAILKVGVVLAHPPDIELVLRKRICLRVYKRMGIGATLMRAFGSKVSSYLTSYIYSSLVD